MTLERDVVVIGGGPAGSTVASFLCRMGHRVLLLEREHFPRHHIGESMIAASIDVLAEIGLEEKLAAAGFPIKSGGCFVWGPSPLPWCIRFDEIPGRPTSYQVKRETFDHILLEHSASLGVDVRQGHHVADVLMEDGRVVGVRYLRPDGATEEARARYVVDASGLGAVIANRLSRRIAAEDLKNMCLYGYWQGEHPAPAKLGGEIRETDRNNIIIKMLENGWLWFIPLGQGLISVGFVAPRQNLPEGGGKAALESFYLERVRAAEEWRYLLGNSGYTGEFHTIKDWSYRSEAMAGPGYFAVGDAACFVDPILSSGAYLAILYGKMAAIGINTLLRFPSRETLVRDWYQGLYEDTYSDYLTMARFWYHGSPEVGAWMDHARQALGAEREPVFAESERRAFLGLATGNAHAHPNYVLLRDVQSFPVPLHLRKDPRGHYLREARTALFGHADREAHDPAHHQEIAVAQRMMAQSPAVRKRVLDVVRSEPAPYVERFDAAGATTTPLPPGARLAVGPRARLALEILEDVVTLVAETPDGVRRVIGDRERELLAASLQDGRAGAAGPEARALLDELVQAGVLVPAR
jgi:flavin-dependent dehydrogenase